MVGRGVVFPWIARIIERARSGLFKTQPYIEHEVGPRQDVQVKAIGNWQQANTPRTLPISAGSCGPLVTRFHPTAGHVYIVDFVWRGDLSCTQVITDATEPGAPPQPVQFQLAQACPTP